MRLDSGDFLFMRDGLARVVWAGDGTRRARPVAFRSLVPKVVRDAAVTFSIGAADQTVLGGAFCIDSPEARMFVAALPPVFCVRRGAPYTARLATIVDELVEEATTPTLGASPVVARLAEVAVLIAVRSFATTDGEGSGLLDAARDPRLGRALATIHDEPARPWTVAEAVGYASTAAFSVAFKRVRGIPPGAVRKQRAA